MNNLKKYWDELSRVGPERSVIDPNDKKGYKNKYISFLRDQYILKYLDGISRSSRILDFGCGSGNLSKTLVDNGYKSIGIDISFDLLKYAKRHALEKSSLFVQYDGNSLPFPSNSFDACVIYGVLIYLTDSELFRTTLQELNRVLKPGGLLIAIEQTRRKSTLKLTEMKCQRSEGEVLQLLEEAYFFNLESCIIRRGHFPLIYAIRYGFVPPIFFPLIVRIEAFCGEVFGTTYWDYADTVFLAEKPA